MGPPNIAANRLSLIFRTGLLLLGLSTYLIFPDDVVWLLIRAARHARVLEHALFGIAAVTLGLALLLRINANAQAKGQGEGGPSAVTATIASLLQAIGIGSLLPLSGFLLLVFGDLLASLLLYGRKSIAESPEAEREFRRAEGPLQAFRWRDTLATHIGLCFAFVSMVIFSVVLIDRVADVLFTMTAIVSIAANSRSFLRCSI
jgi:hypothetical protein